MTFMPIRRISLLLIASLFLSACGSPLSIFDASDQLPGEVRDISRHEEIIRSYHEESPDWTDHFPEQIPASAIDPSFYFLPRVFQGANLVQLKLGIMPDLSSEAIQELEQQVPASLNMSELLNSPQVNDIHELHHCLYIFEHESCQLPDHFIIVFQEDEPLGSDEFIWNHGIERGIAYSSESMEIIFWFSAW